MNTSGIPPFLVFFVTQFFYYAANAVTVESFAFEYVIYFLFNKLEK
jgi:hypothetical protein